MQTLFEQGKCSMLAEHDDHFYIFFSLRNCRIISWARFTGSLCTLGTEGSGSASCHSSGLAALCYKIFITLTCNAPDSLIRGLARSQHCREGAGSVQSPGPDSEGAQVRTLLLVPGPPLGPALCTGFWVSP